MSSFIPSKSHLRHSLLFLFYRKKKAVEAHPLLVETYGEHAPVIRTCGTWFRQFKSGDFDLTDNEHPRAAKKSEDEELQALLDKDPTQSQQQLAQTLNVTQGAICQRLKAMGKIQKSDETVNTDRYRQQIINLNHALIKKRPEWARNMAKLSYNITTHRLIPLKW